MGRRSRKSVSRRRRSSSSKRGKGLHGGAITRDTSLASLILAAGGERTVRDAIVSTELLREHRNLLARRTLNFLVGGASPKAAAKAAAKRKLNRRTAAVKKAFYAAYAATTEAEFSLEEKRGSRDELKAVRELVARMYSLQQKPFDSTRARQLLKGEFKKQVANGNVRPTKEQRRDIAIVLRSATASI